MISPDPISGLIFSWSRLDISCCLWFWPGINAIKITGVEINWELRLFSLDNEGCVSSLPHIISDTNPSLGKNLCSLHSLAGVNIPQSCKEDVFDYLLVYRIPPSPKRSGLQGSSINSMHCSLWCALNRQGTMLNIGIRAEAPLNDSTSQFKYLKRNEISTVHHRFSWSLAECPIKPIITCTCAVCQS